MDRQPLQRARRATVKQPRPSEVDVLADVDVYDDVWPPRLPTSTRRYQSDVRTETGRFQADDCTLEQEDYYPSTPARRSTIPPRRTATRAHIPAYKPELRHTEEPDDSIPRQRSTLLPRNRSRVHWMVYLGGALLVMMLGWFLLSKLMLWWQITQDDWRYGRPRTFQTDAVVGHNNDSASNPSHFIAINLQRHIQIVEIPAGDSSKAKMYVGPVLIGDGQDLTPVTVSFKDVNGDGRVDMIGSVQESRFVFINDKNDMFRPLKPGESIHY